jgi:hypothetical protein
MVRGVPEVFTVIEGINRVKSLPHAFGGSTFFAAFAEAAACLQTSSP